MAGRKLGHKLEMPGPGKSGRPPAQSKRGEHHGKQSESDHCGHAVCHRNDGFGKVHPSLAKKLDEDITKLLDTNENLSVTKAAVFCAMDYLDEYRKSTGSAENMRSQIQDYIADAARAKLAEDKAKAENEVLRREAAALREQLAKERQRETPPGGARRPRCGRDGTGAARRKPRRQTVRRQTRPTE